MRFDPPLVRGRLLKRYKRFFADVLLEDGRQIVAHCPNTGSMMGCAVEGSVVYLLPAKDPKRKLQWTWVMVQLQDTLVGVHTGLAPALIKETMQDTIPAFARHTRVHSEVPYGRENSRIDLLLHHEERTEENYSALNLEQRDIYVEVKNVTLSVEQNGQRLAAFPDSVTTRGQKHIRELMHVVDQGHRAAMVYAVQRSDCSGFTSADPIDPEYGRLLRQAQKAGVELYALTGVFTPGEIRFTNALPIVL